MQFDSILFSIKDQVATITLNTPEKLNAFDAGMIRDVSEALEAAEANGNARVVVIKANGKAFSGGGDISAMSQGLKDGVPVIANTIEPIAAISRKIRRSAKPVIASVHGAVAGAAFNIALACDFCIAADNATFIQAFVKVGLVPDAGGLYLLSRAVGVNKAMHLALLGMPITAEQGKGMGFVFERCPLEELVGLTDNLAADLAKGPAVSYAWMKQLMLASEFAQYEEYTKLEIEAQIACGGTEDYKEGVTAFMEKRKPDFSGI